MALGMTNPHEQDCLNHILGGSEFSFPANIYLALLTGDPGETGTPSGEPAGSSRTALTFGAASAGVASNTNAPTIDTTGWTDTSDLTHAALSVTLGAGLGVFNWYGTLGSTISFTAGDQLTVAAGAISVRFYDTGPVAPGAKITAGASNRWLDHSLGTTQWTTLATPTVSLHTGTPATGVNEFTGGGYVRVNFTLAALGTSGDFTTGTHSNALGFTNIQSTPLRSWGIWQGTELSFIRDQGSDSAVTPGSSIDASSSTLTCLVD